jgi:hypothetical protein
LDPRCLGLGLNGTNRRKIVKIVDEVNGTFTSKGA